MPDSSDHETSPPVRGRGLKPASPPVGLYSERSSPPVRGRGLKPYASVGVSLRFGLRMSPPVRGRGLKP